MKILFIGDYSNFHATLASSLRRMGHDTVVVSSGSRCMDTRRDIDLSRSNGRCGAVRYLCNIISLLPRFSGYDVVQLVNPNFLELKPDKIRYFFDRIKKQNATIGLSLIGNDPYYVAACCKGDTFRYSEYRIGDIPAPFAVTSPHNETSWTSPEMMSHCQYIYDRIDSAISCLYEYHIVGMRYLAHRLAYTGIPIDTETIKYAPLHIDDKVNIFVGVKSEMITFKGTDRLLAAARRVESEYPHKCRVVLVEDLPYDEYMKRLEASHIVLDQIYSYTPATNALGAMAMGKIAVSGAEPEYYDFIGEKELYPIVNVLPDDDDIYRKLVDLITDSDRLQRLSSDSRRFVEKHNAAMSVAQRYIRHINTVCK